MMKRMSKIIIPLGICSPAVAKILGTTRAYSGFLTCNTIPSKEASNIATPSPTIRIVHELSSRPQVVGVCGDNMFFIAFDEDLGQQVLYAMQTFAPATLIPLLTSSSAGINGLDYSSSMRADLSEISYGQCILSIGPKDYGFGGNVFKSDNHRLYSTDGAKEGTHLIKDYAQGSTSEGQYRSHSLVHGGKFYYSLGDACDLWVSDGTMEGSFLLDSDLCVTGLRPMKDDTKTVIVFANGNVYTTDGTKGSMAYVGGEEYQTARTFRTPSKDHIDDGSYFFGTQNSLWRTDGTVEGTWLVKEIAKVASFVKIQDYEMMFVADNGVDGIEPWKSDGTAEGTVMVKDIAPGKWQGSTSAQPDIKVMIHGQAFFEGHAGLYVTDGSADGTRLVKGFDDSHLTMLTPYRGSLFFLVGNIVSRSLWKSDGTSDGTVELCLPGDGGYGTTLKIGVVGEYLYIVAEDVRDYRNFHLFVSNGSTDGTVHAAQGLFPSTYDKSSYVQASDGSIYFACKSGKDSDAKNLCKLDVAGGAANNENAFSGTDDSQKSDSFGIAGSSTSQSALLQTNAALGRSLGILFALYYLIAW